MANMNEIKPLSDAEVVKEHESSGHWPWDWIMSKGLMNFSQYMSRRANQSDRDEMNVDVPLLLVGKTGSGISSTCKSIDGTAQAKQLGGFVPVSRGIETGRRELDGMKITVVATPGVRNDRLCKNDLEKARIGYFHKVICEAFQYAPGGFNAVVLVLSYMERIDHDYTRLICNLKCVLGENALQDHGILLVTGGDNLIRDQGAVTSIADWGKKQSGFFKELYDQCQSRCVLFDNSTEGEQRKESQLKQLMFNVGRLNCEAYTYDAFSATNLKFVTEGDSLSSIEKKLLKEFNRLEKWYHCSGLYNMDGKTRSKLLAMQQRVMNDVKKEMGDNYRITYIDSLKKTVESLSILIDLTANPTQSTKEFNERLKEFKYGFDETFSSLRATLF